MSPSIAGCGPLPIISRLSATLNTGSALVAVIGQPRGEFCMSYGKTFLAVAALAVSGAAIAGNSDITYVSADPVPQVFATVTFNGGISSGVAASLEYIINSTSPAGTFAAFCLEPFQHLTFPYTYSNAGTFTTAQADALSSLFTGANWQSWNYANDGVTTDAQRAGLAYAVWDIMLDGTFDLGAGSFRVLDDGFGGAGVAFAGSSYASGNTSMADNLVRFTDPLQQDLVIAVPEPGTYALMMAGLLAVGFVARRRQSK